MLDLSTTNPVRTQTDLHGHALAENSVTVREAVGVFKDARDLRKAITELDDRFPRHAISVLGGRAEIESEFGQPAVPPSRVMDDPHAPHDVPIRTEEKIIANSVLIGGAGYLGAAAMAIAAGAMAVPAAITAVAIGAGTGVAVGAILAQLLENHFHKDIAEQIEQGGLLLWVHTDDTTQERIACDIMRRHGGTDVRVHTISV